MTTVKLGLTLPQFQPEPERFTAPALEAERLGLDSVWVFDHIWPLTGGRERPAFEAWTSLAWLAARTRTIGIGTLVTRSTLRHPAVLAKMAATVATVAPGRSTIAIGSGDELSRAENEAFGLPFYAGDERIEQLRATVEVLINHLHRERVSIDRKHVTVTDLPTSPRPPTIPPVWVAGRSDDALEVAGVVADGWNGWGGTPERFAQDAGSVIRYAEGRAIELTWGGLVVPGASDREARTRLGERNPAGYVVGGPGTIAERLRAFIGSGATHLILTIAGAWEPDDLSLLAEVKGLLGGTPAD
jgi:alkanesulfonate monooxygenase SsuD/methylene tetrahydromethanopterin reductase-like flavin-dependent oxidoreductase (luciferase family)